MAVFNVDVDAGAVLRRIKSLEAASLSTLMETLGALVEGQTKRRIAAEKTSPDGAKWAPLAPLTVRARRGGSSSQLTDSGRLLGSISHTSGATQSIVGTNVFYAGFHQYGVQGIKPKKGKSLRVPLAGGGAAFIGGSSIPARPFMGVSERNMDEIRKAVNAWVEAQFG